MSEQQWTASRLRVRVPEGWSVSESWTLAAPDGQASVVVAREPLPPVVSTEQYARGRGDRLAAEYPQYQQHVLTVLPLGSGAAYARLFSWAAPGGARVMQTQVYATSAGTGFTATTAAPAASSEFLADLLDGVLRSLEFDAGTTPASAPAPEAVDLRKQPAAEPEAAGEPAIPPATGSTSATVLVQLPRTPPGPPPPRPS